MAQYRCLNCGYSGNELIYQFNDYTYCVASNEEEPEYVDDCPDWVTDRGLGDAEIGEPVRCPKCRAWGVYQFEKSGRCQLELNPMTNTEIAKIFQDIADLLKIKKDNIFKIRAYEKVAKSIQELPVEVEQLVRENRLREIPGVGEAIAKKITEMVNTGRLQFYERLKAEAAKDGGGEVNKQSRT